MKVLILNNTDTGMYSTRMELIDALLERKHEVVLNFPITAPTEIFENKGCRVTNIQLSRRGKNPFKELKLLKAYKKLIKAEKPDVVFTFTIKPNVYGGMACAKLKVDYVANVTGLGDAIENGGIMQKITLFLYKRGLRRAKKVFFQNQTNLDFFVKKKIVKNNYTLIPGSGVNLSKFEPKEYPNNEKTNFVFVGRITKDKGVYELADAIKQISKTNPNVNFDIVGKLDQQENPFEDTPNCILHGQQADVRSFIEKSNAMILPSYHEGMANVLLEAAAMARPVIATDVPGCVETFDEGITGLTIKAKSAESIVNAINKFTSLTFEEQKSMGEKGRTKIEQFFDRQIVIDKYLETL